MKSKYEAIVKQISFLHFRFWTISFKGYTTIFFILRLIFFLFNFSQSPLLANKLTLALCITQKCEANRCQINFYQRFVESYFFPVQRFNCMLVFLQVCERMVQPIPAAEENCYPANHHADSQPSITVSTPSLCFTKMWKIKNTQNMQSQ